MKYKKGTFVVVPNKEYLKGKPSEMQTIYFWLCDHSDEDGECFPSRSRIAREAGCGIRTVDKYLKQLVDEGFLGIESRKNSGSKENMSNLYTLLLKGPYLPKEHHPSVVLDTTPSVEKDAVTIPSINSTQITIIQDVVDKVTLPSSRGGSPFMRLLTIYKDCFRFFYGFEYKPTFGRDLKILKDILESYSELQVARLLTVYFNWHGMDGSDDREFKFLSGATFSLGLFKSNITKYEAYSRNVLQEKFDDDSELLEIVGKHMRSLNS